MEVSEKPVFSCFFFKFELFGPSELLGTHFRSGVSNVRWLAEDQNTEAGDSGGEG